MMEVDFEKRRLDFDVGLKTPSYMTNLSLKTSLLVYRLVHAPVTRESWVRLPDREIFLHIEGG